MIVHMHAKHLRDVLTNLSVQTGAEMDAAGIDDAEDLRHRFLRFMLSGDNTEAHAYVENDEALCVMAVSAHDGVASSFLIAATGFFEASLHRVRTFRDYMKFMVERHGPIYVFSQSPHPQTGKWFELLGARRYEIGGRPEKVYRWG